MMFFTTFQMFQTISNNWKKKKKHPKLYGYATFSSPRCEVSFFLPSTKRGAWKFPKFPWKFLGGKSHEGKFGPGNFTTVSLTSLNTISGDKNARNELWGQTTVLRSKICGSIDSLKNKRNSNFNGKSLEVNKVMIFSQLSVMRVLE